MKNYGNWGFLKRSLALLLIALQFFVSANSQNLPTAMEVANQMTIGWNVGNSLEVPDGETAWGNPMVNQQLITAVKNAGFNTIRIPCAWNSYADQSTYVIDASWLTRVKEVVDYAYNQGMFVILNSHWDNGWLEENPLYSAQDEVNAKQEAYWTQIANYFADYDEHLVFAGANEVRDGYGTPTTENIEVQESYLQTFIDAVRATGGNNLTRTLIVQTYNTNIWHGLNYFTLPTDPTADRLMVEIHHYDPYEFTITGDCTYWGEGYPDGGCSWASETYIEDMFAQLKAQWPDNGIPVVMGEFGAMRRSSGLSDPDYVASRLYWLNFHAALAKASGVIPVYWDNGYYDDNFALFDRSSGSILDQDAIDALLEGVGVAGGPYTISVSSSGSGSVSLNPSGGTYEVGTSVQITATADSGNEFSGWSGDLSGSSNPATITVSKDMNITAIFVEEGAGGSGTILREYWTGITGTGVSALTSSTDYPDNPSGSEQLTSLEGPTDWADNYGARIRGYVHPTVSGDYTFWVAGDDNVELYLSSDETAANAQLIASVSGWTSSQQWDKYSTQQSSTIALVAGQKYYIEVLQKEGTGGDNVAVAWQGPGITQAVIDGIYLSPYEATSTPVNNTPVAALSATPTSGTVDLTVSFDASASSDVDGDALTYSWDFGDGSIGSGETVSYTYTTEGSYTATLTVSDGSLSDTETVTITVNEGTTQNNAPVATLSATPTSGTVDLTVSFDASSSYDADGDALTYAWDFGDGSTGIGETVSYTYTIEGTYTATLTVSDGLLTDTETVSITVNAASSGTATCDSPESVTLPIVVEGKVEQCIEISEDISYVNSWGVKTVEINGVDYSNMWSNSFPDKIDGKYYVYIKMNSSWSHFEAVGSSNKSLELKSTEKLLSTKVYPNPFKESLTLQVANVDKVKRIEVLDQVGRMMKTYEKSSINTKMEIGCELKAGIYFIRIVQQDKVETIKANKVK